MSLVMGQTKQKFQRVFKPKSNPALNQHLARNTAICGFAYSDSPLIVTISAIPDGVTIRGSHCNYKPLNPNSVRT